jgi:hypothetical protein
MPSLSPNRKAQIKKNLKRGKEPKQGVGGSFQAGLGAQLSNRLSNGAVTQQRAQQTASERQLLAQAYGPNWRTKVFGQGGAQAIDGPFAQNVIRQKRARALDRARKKVGSVGGGRAL